MLLSTSICTLMVDGVIKLCSFATNTSIFETNLLRLASLIMTTAVGSGLGLFYGVVRVDGIPDNLTMVITVIGLVYVGATVGAAFGWLRNKEMQGKDRKESAQLNGDWAIKKNPFMFKTKPKTKAPITKKFLALPDGTLISR